VSDDVWPRFTDSDDLAAAERRGYDRAVANLRDGDRYLKWWSSAACKPDGPPREHLANYLEATKETTP